MSILILCPDLFFTTKIVATAKKMGLQAATTATCEEAITKVQTMKPSLIIVDLAAVKGKIGDSIAALRKASTEGSAIIAYGSHVEKGPREEAVHAGCDDVLVRSEFSQNLPSLLQKYTVGTP